MPVNYDLSLVNLSKLGLIKSKMKKIFVIVEDLKSYCERENGQDRKKKRKKKKVGNGTS